MQSTYVCSVILKNRVMRYILFSFFIFSAASSFAQRPVKGSVYTEKQEAVEGATVVLYKSSDSTMDRIAVTEKDGSFAIEPSEGDVYFLEITFVGLESFEKQDLNLKEGQEVDLGKIVLKASAETLEGVVVTARKPMIERKLDKLVVNVESSISASTGSALELLEKAPGVDVDKDGNISMRGKSGVLILIDDRPTHMSAADLANYLKTLPASSLEQLEIMTNPSAKYDASGNSGIINIKTKHIKNYGLNGSVALNGSYADYYRGSGSLNLNYRKSNVNLFGNYSRSAGSYWNESNLLRTFLEGPAHQIVAQFDQDTRNVSDFRSDNAKIGMDYYAGKNTIAGIVLTGYFGDRTVHLSSHSQLKLADGNIESVLDASNVVAGVTDNFSVNANLRHSFDSSGRKMTADVDYIRYNQSGNLHSVTDYFNADGSVQKPASLLLGNTPSVIEIYSGKTDFSLPANRLSKFETGIKFSMVKTDNDAVYRNRTDKGDEIDYTKSNRFLYDEAIWAAYGSWSYQLKKWGFQAGLRAEQTLSEGRQLGNKEIADSSFTKRYFNLFPTGYISYNASEAQSFGLNYGRRIQRPQYSSMNPFLYFLDEYTYEAGNVYLQPEFTDKVELSHSYKGLLHSSVSYSHTANAIGQVIRQDNDKRITYQTTDNIASKKSFSVGVGSNFKTGKMFHTSMDFIVNNEHFEGLLASGYLKTSGWMLMGKMTEQIRFGKGWSSEIGAYYRSAGVDGQIKYDPMWRADFSLQKTVWNNKGNITVFVRDIFDSQRFDGIIESNDIHLKVHNEWPSRTFGVSFKYSFGKPIKGLKQHNQGSAGDERSRIKTD